MDNIEYTICRYELYPPNFPESIAVGFLVKDTETGNTGTMERLIPLTDILDKNQSEVCNLAFTRLSEENKKLIEFFENKRQSIVGSVFIPNENIVGNVFIPN